jgi:hypothetical protein
VLPAVFGYVFNPVSFWFCHNRAGADRRAGRGQQHLRRPHGYLLHNTRRRAPADGQELLQAEQGVSCLAVLRGRGRLPLPLPPAAPLPAHARIDYDDTEGELLLTAISGKPQAWSTRAARRLPAHAPADGRRHGPHPLAGPETLAQRRALHRRAPDFPTPPGIEQMNNTMILRGSDSLARDTRLVFELLEKLQGRLLEVRLPDGSSRLFGDGEHGVTLQVHDEAMFGRCWPAATSAWPKPISTATGIRPTSPAC